MKIKVIKEEVYPVYIEDDTDSKYAIRSEIDIDPRIWEDYKMARNKFMKLRRKVLNKENEQIKNS